MRKDRESARDKFIETARSQVGYRALPMKQSVFGQAAGYQGTTWNGSFVDWVINQTDTDLPRFTASTAALAQLLRAQRIFRVPAVGDVVFLETGTEDFGQPAVGVVTDTSEWSRMRAVKVVLAQVGSPSPRGSNEPNGVFERTYYETDVMAFARPRFGGRRLFRVPAQEIKSGRPEVRAAHFVYGKTNRSVAEMQTALGLTVGLSNAVKGKFDSQTRSAYASWQRRCGLVGSDADGTVDTASLRRLGETTGLFTVKD